MADLGLLPTGVLWGGIGGGVSSLPPLPLWLLLGSPFFTLFLSSIPFLDCCNLSEALFSCTIFVTATLMSSLDNLVASLYTGGGGR